MGHSVVVTIPSSGNFRVTSLSKESPDDDVCVYVYVCIQEYGAATPTPRRPTMLRATRRVLVTLPADPARIAKLEAAVAKAVEYDGDAWYREQILLLVDKHAVRDLRRLQQDRAYTAAQRQLVEGRLEEVVVGKAVRAARRTAGPTTGFDVYKARHPGSGRLPEELELFYKYAPEEERAACAAEAAQNAARLAVLMGDEAQ